MKPIMIALLIFLNPFVWSQAARADNPIPLITVNAEGSAKALPDQATLHLSFSQTSHKVREARKVVDRQVDKLIKALEDFELAQNSLDTSQSHIHPQYDYQQGQQQLRGYQVTRQVQFILRDLDQLENLIQTITELEVSQLQRLQFGLSDPGSVKQLALDQAIQRSRQLAQHIADQYDAKLGSVHTVRYQAQGPHAPAPVMAMRAEMAADSAPTYQQKELEFNAHIEVSFKLR